MKKIAIQTTFTGFDEAYSLCNVVSDQIKALVTHGYEPVVIVAEGFKPVHWFANGKVTLKYIPSVPCYNEVRKDKTFDEDVEKLKNAFREALKGVDIVITHDLIYQNASLKHNIACRAIASEFPKLRWLHWIHSATSPFTINQIRPIFQDIYISLLAQKFPNSNPVFFNDYSKRRIAKNFGYEIYEVKIVHHPTDICYRLGMDEVTERFVLENDILSADVIDVYPIRLDRGKQVEIVIKTLACLKEKGYSVRGIIVDFHSNSKNPNDPKFRYREELKNIAIDWGLSPPEILFTSQYDPKWDLSVGHKTLMQLLNLSNLFIMPSVSESYSLVTQEASLFGKALLVLNQDFPPFRDIYGPKAVYRKYSSAIDTLTGMDGRTTTTYDQGEHFYHMETANIIAWHLENDYSLAMNRKLRKERNLNKIFETELEPLFYEAKS